MAWIEVEHTARDGRSLRQGLRPLLRYFAKSVSTSHGRSLKMSEAWWDAAPQELAKHHRRVLYAVAQHKNKGADYAVAYVGHTHSQMDGYVGPRHIRLF